MIRIDNQNIVSPFCIVLAAIAASAIVVLAVEQEVVSSKTTLNPPMLVKPNENEMFAPKKNLSEEMQLITKSLDDLMSELAVIKREAMGRLSSVKKVSSNEVEPERIRQTKVSRFVLRRVIELEGESQSMREELSKLFELGKLPASQLYFAGQGKQEDHDFDEAPTRKPLRPTTGASGMPASTATTSTTTSTTTIKPDEEAEKIGFDVEALKKLGEEIGKRLDQFGKEAAKNLGELVEGVKLVFREPKKPTPTPKDSGDTIDQQIRQLQRNGRQMQPAQQQALPARIMKFVTEQSARVVDNIQQGINRMTSMVGFRRNNSTAAGAATTTTANNNQATVVGGKPQRSSSARMLIHQQAELQREANSFDQAKQSLLGRLELVNTKLNDFEADWTQVMGRQQSPLIDRIPPRGVELWRDFWDTFRKQIRRINEEFMQLSRDVTRVVTGRNPAQGTRPSPPNYGRPAALASPSSGLEALNAAETIQEQSNEKNPNKEFYEKMEKMHEKLGQLVESDSLPERINYIDQASNLIDEHDDELTKQELRRNPALRQQIQQEISVFGSIFDIMRAFMQRLRESASTVVRDIISPGSSTINNNDAVTPTSAVKPQIDQILDQTIDSQRNINSQAKPVLLPNSRPTMASSP